MTQIYVFVDVDVLGHDVLMDKANGKRDVNRIEIRKETNRVDINYVHGILNYIKVYGEVGVNVYNGKVDEVLTVNVVIILNEVTYNLRGYQNIKSNNGVKELFFSVHYGIVMDGYKIISEYKGCNRNRFSPYFQRQVKS